MDSSSAPTHFFDRKSIRLSRLLLKTVLLFLAANLLASLINPLPFLGRITLYNHLVPGRERLPYGDDPAKSYNLSLFQLDAMFASHELSGEPKPAGEYRVILIGDSATWGYLLKPDQTLAEAINSAGLSLPDKRQIKVYNLGYPVMSLMKDLLILSYAMRYDPDLIIWPVTLESFPYDKQLFPPLLQNNPEAVRTLIQEYGLRLNPQDPALKEPPFFAKTLVGERRNLADLVRLQVYGLLWAATGIDQDIPPVIPGKQSDLPADASFHDLHPPQLSKDDLAFDILHAGLRMAGSTPVLLVNEPMFISQGKNSDVRYNFYYPRWAYDGYRRLLREESQANQWNYLDLWDVVPPPEFTNTAVHLSPNGTVMFARLLGRAILETANQSLTP